MDNLKYFKPEEFFMGDRDNIVFDKMDRPFLRKLDLLRHNTGVPMVITSSFRTPEYNEAIKGGTASKHLEGIAVDVSCTNGKDRLKIIEEAIDLGFTVGVGKTFLHLDNRFDQIIFGYGS